jgi:hypothetical protein
MERAAPEMADLRVDDTGGGMGIDMQDDEPLFVQAPIIHSAKELDHRSRFQATPNLRQPKVIGKARANVHAQLLVVQLRDDFF